MHTVTFAAEFLGIDLAQAAQLAVNGLINGSAYALLGLSFGLILGVTGRFHFAFAFVYTLTAYVATILVSDVGVNFWLALPVGLAAGAVAGVLCEALVYRPLAARSGSTALLTIFVASLGLTIAGHNAITLKWGTGSRPLEGFPTEGVTVGSVTFTTVDIGAVTATWILVVVLTGLLGYTQLGREIQAVRVNPEMSRAVGIEIRNIYLVVFAIGSFLGGVAALFFAMKFASVPDMGIRPVFYAFVVAFLAGTSSHPIVVGLVGVFVGLVESLSALWLSTQWASVVVFALLFLYLSYRSLWVTLARQSAASIRRALPLGLGRVLAR